MSTATPAQRRAADPARSVWVTANAGTGKTRVLADRVLRLLLGGTAPETILCITFTKAAAAEMVARVERQLAAWAVASDEAALAAEIEALTGEPPSPRWLERAPQLFARVLDLPQGLPIQTIHALCGSLLRRFPIEAGIAPHFEVIDDRTAQELLTEAKAAVLGEARQADSSIGRAVGRLAVAVADSTFTEVLAEALARRVRLVAARRDRQGLDGLLRAIALALDVDDVETTPAAIVERACADGVYDGQGLLAAANALRRGGVKDQQCAELIASWLDAGPARRVVLFDSYRRAFFTKAGAAIDKVASKKVAQDAAALHALQMEQARLLRVGDALKALAIYGRTEALLRVAYATIDRYEAEKARTAALDYDDLIERTRDLLETRDGRDWVRFKLDARVDHVLVDEAQDTSPAQWDVVERLTEEFFAGEGRRERAPTLFVVGDEKQSIYSFQGADLANLRAIRSRLRQRAVDAGQPFHEETLDRSFRSVPAVLELVDRVFALPAARDGVLDPGQTLRHDTARHNESGLVELWPLAEPASEPARREPWPLPDQPRHEEDPQRQLASAIAGRIRTWLATGECLEGRGRPMRAGDILVLLSRRGELQELIVRALKRLEVPVAGADRLQLASHIAVMDLVALGRAILLPEDDLNLACLLKSPLLGLDDDDLFVLAHDRGRTSLLERLRALAPGRPRLERAYARLGDWIRLGDFMPPFELFTTVLGEHRGREALLARLGPDAAEPIEAFLAQTLAYEQGHPASLEGFIHWLGLGSDELKRDADQDRDAVRVMTVHGAKGLEAPVVILADAGPARPPGDGRLLWGEDGLPLWRAARSGRDPLTARLADARQARDEAERRRLLYVALTRAGDRLYVTGRKPANGKTEACWHELVREALLGADGLETRPAELGKGFSGPLLRLRRGSLASPRERGEAVSASERQTLPPWASRPIAADSEPVPPRAPSRLGGDEPPPSSPAGAEAELRFRFGLHVHKLLQLAPDLPPDRRPTVIEDYLRAQPDLDAAERERARRSVLAVLDHPDLGRAFGPGSRAEQAICGMLDGQPIAGQIDRLLVRDDGVLIVDYKTNRRPRADGRVPVAYLRQMAAYRELLRRIYPDRPVEAALVWTETATVEPLESAVLDAHIPGRMAVRAASG